jgi:hypothetical protein
MRAMRPNGLRIYDDPMETVQVNAGDRVTKDLKRRKPK